MATSIDYQSCDEVAPSPATVSAHGPTHGLFTRRFLYLGIQDPLLLSVNPGFELKVTSDLCALPLAKFCRVFDRDTQRRSLQRPGRSEQF